MDGWMEFEKCFRFEEKILQDAAMIWSISAASEARSM